MDFNLKNMLTNMHKKLYSVGKNASLHPTVHFNNNPVNSAKIHKHFGMVLDSRLNHENHIKFVLSKMNTTIGLLQKFQPVQPVL